MYRAACSAGEIVERWAMLHVRLRRSEDATARRECIRRLYAMDMPDVSGNELAASAADALQRLTEQAWDLDRQLRDATARDDVPAIVSVARTLAVVNDARAHLVKRLDTLLP